MTALRVPAHASGVCATGYSRMSMRSALSVCSAAVFVFGAMAAAFIAEVGGTGTKKWWYPLS